MSFIINVSGTAAETEAALGRYVPENPLASHIRDTLTATVDQLAEMTDEDAVFYVSASGHAEPPSFGITVTLRSPVPVPAAPPGPNA